MSVFSGLKFNSDLNVNQQESSCIYKFEFIIMHLHVKKKSFSGLKGSEYNHIDCRRRKKGP